MGKAEGSGREQWAGAEGRAVGKLCGRSSLEARGWGSAWSEQHPRTLVAACGGQVWPSSMAPPPARHAAAAEGTKRQGAKSHPKR